MKTTDMIIYWREAAEAAEAKVIETREALKQTQKDLEWTKADYEERIDRAWKRVKQLETQISEFKKEGAK